VFSTFFNNKRTITSTVKEKQENGTVTVMLWGIGGQYKITNTPERFHTKPDAAITIDGNEYVTIRSLVGSVCDILDYHPVLAYGED